MVRRRAVAHWSRRRHNDRRPERSRREAGRHLVMASRNRALPALAARLGYVVTKTKRGHLKCGLPSGAVVFVASTPSDHRAIHNAAAMLRRVRGRAQQQENTP